MTKNVFIKITLMISIVLLVCIQISFCQVELVNSFVHDATYPNSAASTTDAVLSPDNKFIITAGGSKSVVLWDVKNGTKIHEYTGSSYFIQSLCFSDDGSKIAAGCKDNSFVIWDFTTGSILQQKNDPSLYPGSGFDHITFSRSGQYILFRPVPGSSTYGIFLWDWVIGKNLHEFPAELNIYDIKFSPDDKYVFSTGSESILYSTETGEMVEQYSDITYGVITDDFLEITYEKTEDNNLSETTFYKIDSKSKVVKETNKYKKLYKGALKLKSPNGLLAITEDDENQMGIRPLELIHLKTGEILGNMNELKNNVYNKIRFSKDNKYFIAINQDKGADVYDISKFHAKIKEFEKY